VRLIIVRRSIAAYLWVVRISAFLTEICRNRTMKRLSPRNTVSFKDVLARIDRVAGDLNVLLVVIAIGLATLDLTFLVTQNVVNHLPPVTRVAPGPCGGPAL
jgi:hypothetical protein